MNNVTVTLPVVQSFLDEKTVFLVLPLRMNQRECSTGSNSDFVIFRMTYENLMIVSL